MKKIDNTKEAKKHIDKLYHGERGYFFSDGYCGYCRDDCVRQFKEDLEKWNIDSTKVRIVHTHHLGKNPERPIHHYNFIWRFNSEGNLDRPLCVECGSSEVISKGISWYCKACGRWFLRKPRKKA